ncbi:uncharacterized protein LOC133784972 [Humulus lupulus]|uniref:uncharacterized protein LOC133784972 n=1 Tax=Humulus lupulus TaxID=3486 RepID=UPI002B40E26F|nr:uncharacterized protein LOC133784972 [Humulus lupulus]
MKGIMRFEKKWKLSPKFIGPFEILDKLGQVAYQLALPPSLAETHDVFHISMLRKYVLDPSDVLNYEALELKHNFSYEERPVRVLEQGTKELRSKSIPIFKILWSHITERDATLEMKEDMRERYPEVFNKAHSSPSAIPHVDILAVELELLVEAVAESEVTAESIVVIASAILPLVDVV